MPRRFRTVSLVIVALLIVAAPFLLGRVGSTGSIEAVPPELPPAPTTTSTPIPTSPLVASGTFEMADELEFIEELQAQLEADAAIANPTTTTTTQPATTNSETTADSPASTTTTTAPPSTTTTHDSPSTTQPPATTTTSPGGYDSAAEGDFASRINSYRSSNGESSLARHSSLDGHARSWARAMAESGSISHSNIGSLLPPWSAVAENVGQGGSVGSIFDALASSSGHRSNMLGDYTHVGVGVYADGNGQLWTAHVFAG